MDGMIEARCPNGDAIIFAIDFVPREWATGWEINGRIVSALRGMDALLTSETMPRTVRALKELGEMGFVEMRKNPEGFAEWRLTAWEKT
ncbi:MAG: hypothetical protein IKR86_09180 [Candidatus Methanomethylophilaceae archaeon]|nr:hypothetical protein [Candidatus Methanomethylophilaceae archaeon]